MRKFRFADGAILAAVLFAAALFSLVPLFFRQAGERLSVQTDEGITNYTLHQDQTLFLKSNGYSLTVVIRNGEAFVQSADCPDETCVHTGSISHEGEIVVCVPSHTVLRITEGGDRDDNADALAG